MKTLSLVLAPVILVACGAASAQDPVVPAADQDALFHSKDPKLDANKQAVYHIFKDLLQANHWELADKWLTKRYIQHNPNAKNGLDGVVYYFTQVRKVKPTPIPAHLSYRIVSVVAEGDMVTVAASREQPDPSDPSKKYTTTWFDQYRMVDGKADEHWDPATKAPPGK
ncbi:MAG TPA: nuclear transport factor 2 family protein [Steroidobacteraceae bacterium]|jgi:predicted SnoaL-like aldol condensation-catalyzing enzyme|nr:nuclear transport factor 2 family protein [Steroidobacteraceae bacterium]